MIEVLLILGALALVAACGAFVAAEFSFVTVDRGTVDRAVENGEPGAKGVQSALRSLSTQLSSAQVGITVTNLLIGYMAEPSIARLVDGPLESIGIPEDVVPGIALGIALDPRDGRDDGVRRARAEEPRDRQAAGDGQGRPGLPARVHARCRLRSSRSSTTPRTRSCAGSASSRRRSWRPPGRPRSSPRSSAARRRRARCTAAPRRCCSAHSRSASAPRTRS